MLKINKILKTIQEFSVTKALSAVIQQQDNLPFFFSLQIQLSSGDFNDQISVISIDISPFKALEAKPSKLSIPRLTVT